MIVPWDQQAGSNRHPVEYAVEGSVSRNDTRVVLRGTREVQERCAPTGRVRTDRLVFGYAFDC